MVLGKATAILATLLLAASCADDRAPKVVSPPAAPLPAWAGAGEPAPYLAKMVGEQHLTIMRHADRVESFRIDPDWQPLEPNSINGYRLKAKGPQLNSKQLAAAVRMTTRLESSFPLGAKLCGEIRPGVALRFHRGNEYVTALICFHCKEWYFVLGDDAGENERRHRNKLNFEGTQPQLLQLIQALFPRDEQIAAIAAERRYTVAYQVAAALPTSDEDIRKDYDMVYEKGPVSVLAKYLPESAAKVKGWDMEGGFGDSAIPLDGLLFIHTTKENHAVIEEEKGVRRLE